MVNTTVYVHYLTMPSNFWNHDWRSKSNGSISYSVHKVTRFMVQCAKHYKNLCDHAKGQEKIKTTILVHNFIIPANCWNHDRRSMLNGLISYSVHKVTRFMVQCAKSFRDLAKRSRKGTKIKRMRNMEERKGQERGEEDKSKIKPVVSWLDAFPF